MFNLLQDFASAMQKVSENPEIAARMGVLARQHVVNKFSRRAFGAQLDFHFEDMKRAQVAHRVTSKNSSSVLVFWTFFVLSVALSYCQYFWLLR